jgi:excisionase family DNA binding protein
VPVLKRRRADQAARTEPRGITAATSYAALPEFLRVPEVALLWRVSPSTVYAMLARGELTGHRFGHCVRIPKEQTQRKVRK